MKTVERTKGMIWQQIQIAIKYSSDRILAVLFTLLLLPLLLLVAVMIKLTDGGSVFFRQYRLGLHAKPFRIWKFRTMVMNADKLLNDDGTASCPSTTLTVFIRITRSRNSEKIFDVL